MAEQLAQKESPTVIQNDPTKNLKRDETCQPGKLRILVIGKMGQGKSALINGLVGKKIAPEGAVNLFTSVVTEYSIELKGISVTVFDSPGLHNDVHASTDIHAQVQNMKERCQRLSLLVYCMKMTNHRLTKDDKSILKKLTQAFGERIWEYSVIALTFANDENCGRRDIRDNDPPLEPQYDDMDSWEELKKRRFQGRLKIWEDGLKDFLRKEVEIDHEIVGRISVVPTGDYRISLDNQTPYRLPDRNDWFDTFWECCCLRIKDTQLFDENENTMTSLDHDDDDHYTCTSSAVSDGENNNVQVRKEIVPAHYINSSTQVLETTESVCSKITALALRLYRFLVGS